MQATAPSCARPCCLSLDSFRIGYSRATRCALRCWLGSINSRVSRNTCSVSTTETTGICCSISWRRYRTAGWHSRFTRCLIRFGWRLTTVSTAAGITRCTMPAQTDIQRNGLRKTDSIHDGLQHRLCNVGRRTSDAALKFFGAVPKSRAWKTETTSRSALVIQGTKKLRHSRTLYASSEKRKARGTLKTSHIAHRNGTKPMRTTCATW